MHGSHSFFGVLRRRLRDERGWALVDALASSVVVVLAFVGTTMAFNGSTASVASNAKKTQALVVAQNEINFLRSKAGQDINGLINTYDNTTKTVVYKGTTYTVERSAYYVTGLGSDRQDACEVAYSSGGGAARYIYIRVKVTYAGQLNSASGSSSSYLSSPASLDTYFSPEGGGVQADTGTLRVYVLNRNNGVAGITSNIELYIAGNTTPLRTEAINTTTGCVLFTGLVRNTYVVKVPVTSKQDIYMTNSSSINKVSLPVVMPDRGALSREVRIDLPVPVTTRFYTSTGTNANYEVRTANGNTNPFFGSWVGATDQIKASPTTDYSHVPSGLSFMPHVNTPSAASLPTSMFANAAGYATWAGPCDINNPNIGVTDGSNYQLPLPANASDSAWLPGSTGYAHSLWLSQIRTTLSLSGVTGPPSPTFGSRTYYYGLAFNSPATVRVKLKSDTDGSTATARCRPSTNLVNTWQTLGTVNASGVRLAPDAESLPVGRYDVCVTFPWKATRRTTSFSNTLQTPTTVSGTVYFSSTDIDLGYRTFVNAAFAASWPTTSQSTPTLDSYGSTTNCAV
ncbi:MAG: hypothetical protein JHD02_01670 [Thermoleophilaceae bacterium]|nr:hypothetical protein [Thermoleophilaceae bacterium]